VYGKASAGSKTYIESAHDWCMNTLHSFITDRRALGLVQSMLIGDETNLEEETRQAFTETGIVHVIAISGGNIAVLFVVVLFLLRWMRHKKYLWLKYIISLPLVWFYVLMAGGAPSAVRAALMFSLLAIGFARQNRADNNSLNHLLATAFLLLVAQPNWLYAIGFQLSFVAVLSLILFYKHIYRRLAPVNKITKALWSVVAASIAAEILIAPLVIYYFHSFPLWFIVSNVLAYVLMGLVLISGISLLVLSFLPFVAKFIGQVIGNMVSIFSYLLDVLRDLEPDAFHSLRLDEIGLCLLYAFIASMAVYLIRKEKRAAIVALSLACSLTILFCIQGWRDLQQQRLVVYNAGKGRHIEWISGSTYAVIASDSAGSAEYITKQAHIGWQSLKEVNVAADMVTINNKTAVILKEPVQQISEVRDIDYLILAYTARPGDLRRIKESFRPAVLVLSAMLPENQLNDWKTICEQAGIKLHTPEEGAFVLE
jgi:competence protein ComEC